jgi:anti-sigma-K factor RskA
VIRQRPEPHTLAGAFAMDALDGVDHHRFVRHLGRCRECADEVDGLLEVAGRLALASGSRPPDLLKVQILGMTERTRQLSPVVSASGPRLFAGTTRLAVAVAGAVLIAMAAIWVSGLPARHVPVSRRVAGPTITAVLTAPDAVMFGAHVTGGGRATIVMSQRQGRLVFAADGLRTLPRSRCYELWLMNHGKDRPAGLLATSKHGMTGPVIATGLSSGDRLGLSVEPAAGSRSPTSPMILVVAL